MYEVLVFVLQLIFFGLLSASVIFYYQLYCLKNKFKDVWMPFHLPLLGIGHLFLTKPFIPVLKDLYHFSQSSIVAKFGFDEVYITTDVNEINIVLNNPNSLSKPKMYKIFAGALGNSLLTAPVEIWKPNRKSIAKCFSSLKLDTFVPIFYEKSKTLVEILKKEKNVNIFDKLGRLTYDSFCATTLGTSNNLQLKGDDRIIELFMTLQKLALDKFFRPWEHHDWIFFNLPKGRRARAMFQELKDIVYNIIKAKRQINHNLKNDYTDEIRNKTVLDVMLELQEKENFDEDFIIDETLLMVGAATDTSASTMSFTCGMIGMHPEVQERIYKEVIDTVGLHKPIEAKDLTNLKYTERVINESMRLFPVAPIFGRQTSGPVNIGSRILEPNTDVLIFAFALHRDPKIYPDPLRFDPDRFLPEEVSKRPPSSFIPFSVGVRNCIGLKYAYLIMKTTIANIVRNFKIETEPKKVEDITIGPSIVMTSDNLKCTFIPRENH